MANDFGWIGNAISGAQDAWNKTRARGEQNLEELQRAIEWRSRAYRIPISVVQEQVRSGALNPNNLYRAYQDSLGPTAGQVSAAQRPLWAGGDSLPEDPAKGQAKDLLQLQIRTGRWSVPFDISGLISQVVGSPNAFDLLVSKIVADPRFKKEYPGIFDKDGNLRYSPGEYRKRESEVREIGAQYGLSYTKAQMGRMISGDKSNSEIDFQAKAVQMVKNNAGYLTAFKQQVDMVNEQRRARGQKPIKNISDPKSAVDFILGFSSPSLYAIYESASISAEAKGAGISLSAARARRLAMARPGLEGPAETQLRFMQLAEEGRSSFTELQAFGVSQDDLINVEYGLPPQQQAAALRIERAKKQAEASRGVDIQGEQTVLSGGRPTVRGAPVEEGA